MILDTELHDRGSQNGYRGRCVGRDGDTYKAVGHISI
jgi:hypothetical protein